MVVSSWSRSSSWPNQTHFGKEVGMSVKYWATKLEDLSFRCEEANARWITMALQTVQSENLH